MQFIETSAKTPQNIDMVFEKMILEIKENKRNEFIQTPEID